MTAQKYDIIADIHGYAEHLKGLLARLGYTGEIHRHPEGRKVVFLGDFVDRGPDIRGTLKIARSMVDAGYALAIMGNHEYNAIAYATPDGHGSYLRPHTDENIRQHAATLAAFEGHETEWQECLRWFATLPLFLDFGGLRVVHACWDGRLIAALGGDGRFTEDMLHPFDVKRTERQKAADILLKGPEITMPEGMGYTGKDGIRRDAVRVKWWLNDPPMNYRDVSLQLPVGPPDHPVAEKYRAKLCGYPPDAAPVLFGHYGYVKPAEPLAPNVACIDLGVSSGGMLCAYRWNGEARLRRDAFVTYP